MKLKKIHYCLLLIAYCLATKAQIYPVQVNSSLVPPYTTTVSDYSTTLNEKFVANIFTNDLTISNRQIQLKLYIEGSNVQAVSTPIINGYQPLYIDGGQSLRLTNVDLAAYFRLENLQGINPTVYGSSLPQGLYKFCIEVYDYNTQIKISQKSCAMAYFIVNDPPFLNLPVNHENIPSQEPQNIIFTWSPRHLNATNIEYEYTLVELQDNLAPTNYAFLVTQPIHKVITNNTILLYGPIEPLLIPGKKYAWRVQARSQIGFGDTAAFQNNGYSEIYDFVFQGNCDKPTFTLAEALSSTQAKITWQANPNHLNYLVQYRKKGTNIWFDVETIATEVKLYDLEPLTVYECRVGGYCTGNVLSFSNIYEFTQPNTNVNAINCGISPDVDLSNQTLFNGALGDGQVFTAGDYPIHVTEAAGSGSYTGKGWTKAPYLNSIRLAVIFTDIKINTDLKLVQGEVKAVYDPTWSNIADINAIVDQVENVLDVVQQSPDVHTYNVTFPIGNVSNITLVNGQIIVVNPATGTTGAILDHDSGETTTITDSQGSVYTVSPNGQIQQVAVGIGIPNPTNTENVNAASQATALSNVGVTVTFKKSDISGKKSIAAEDKGVPSTAPEKIQALYKTIKDGQNNDYPLYYKAIINKEDGNASYEYVIAEINITDNTIKADSLIFNRKGVKVEATELPNEGTMIRRLLKVPAFTTVGEEQVLALLKNGTQKQKVVGAMVSVAIKDVGAVNITLVPVNNASIPTDIETQLNNIYAGVGVTLNIKTANNYSTTKTTMECGTSGWIANYTEDQKTFINDYKNANPPATDEYYIFITQNIAPSRPISGFMPLHRQFGFVFAGQTSGNEVKENGVSGIASIIAHELGHGVFELEHPWEKYSYNKNAASTSWLMDYASGTQLPYKDWQTISHPKTKLYLFQSDGSGEYPTNELITNLTIDDLSSFTEENIPFLTPSGEIVLLKKADFYDLSFYTNGSLMGFSENKLLSDVRYFAQVTNNNTNEFRGYSDRTKNDSYFDFKNANVLPLYVYLAKQATDNCKMIIEKVNLKQYIKYDYQKKNKVDIIAIINNSISNFEITSLAKCKNEILNRLITESYSNNSLTINDCELVINHLHRYFSTKEVEEFQYENKTNLIKFFSFNKCNLRDNFTDPRKSERYFAACFEKIPEDKQNGFLDNLITDNTLKFILSEVDTKWLLTSGDDNFSKILSNLSRYSNIAKNNTGFKEDIITINFNNSNNVLLSNAFTFNLQTDKFRYDYGASLVYLLIANGQPLTFGVYDPIIVNFIEPFTFNGIVFSGKKPMPAIYFYLIANERANQSSIAAANVILDVASICSGTILLKQMYQQTAKAVLKSPKFWRHTVGVSLATLNVTFNTVLINKLEGTKFLEYWNTINLIYGITDLGFNLNDFLNAKSIAKTKLTSESAEIQNEFDNIANELEVKVGLNGAGNAFRGITKTQFFESVAEFKVSSTGLLGDQAWDLWKAEKWGDLETLFKNNNLNGKWPPNRGFINVIFEPLAVGKEIDRYGGYVDNADGLFKDKGTFASPKGATFESRALPAETINKPYVKYKVVKEIPSVNKGEAIPWFGQKGKGIQYELPESIDDLLKGGYITKIRDSWNGYSKIFKATADEVLEATNRIKNYRTSTNLSGKNCGYLEGTINGSPVDKKIWLSGEAKPELEPQIFTAINVEGGGGRSWLRNTDSEYKMLNKLASDLGGKFRSVKTAVTGEVKIISELPYCASCQGIIQQFNEMFPNVKLILIDGAK